MTIAVRVTVTLAVFPYLVFGVTVVIVVTARFPWNMESVLRNCYGPFEKATEPTVAVLKGPRQDQVGAPRSRFTKRVVLCSVH